MNSPQVFVLFLCLAYGMVHPQVIPLCFDAPFSISLYQQALDESMHLYGDVCELHKGRVCLADRLLAADLITGRIVRLTGILDELAAEQQKVGAYLQEDGAYLATILGCMQQAYQALQESHQYRNIMPLLMNIQRTLAQSFGL